MKEFERDEHCLPNCWIVVRIDGRNFSKFCDTHQFAKPNDVAALELMNRSAITVMEDFKEIILGFGQSDEYSFVFRKDTQLYKRRGKKKMRDSLSLTTRPLRNEEIPHRRGAAVSARVYALLCTQCLLRFVSASKLMSNVNSLFTSAYVYHWPRFFRGKEMYYPPSFDARVVLYPTDKNLRDYLAWRQADVHVNNLYNTCFWNLILKGKLTPNQVSSRNSVFRRQVKLVS